ncbi:MAG: hypothetical protein FWD49_01065 [Firmicutes bacterium]|nr:hypothetical protein [Bacillota bacterium]
MKNSYDIVVVGAGTAGMFFAKRMAETGYSVLVTDILPENRLAERLDVFHIDQPYFAKYGIPEPKEGDEDFLTIFEYSTFKSAFSNHPKRVDYPFSVIRLGLFMKRFKKVVDEAGVEFAFETPFKAFLYDENGKIAGIKAEKGGKEVNISARLVVDASGIPSVARRQLPDTSPVENFEIGDNDKFYVTIRYAKIKDPRDYITANTGWAYYKAWTAPALTPDTAIFGVGANGSFENGEKVYKEFEKVANLPEHTVEQIQKGATPFRRTPFSFVDDNFICIGDSACLTKPFSGEGVASQWNHAEIAVNVASEAMRDGGIPTKEKLWDINVKYNQTQGADFAYIFATVINAVDCSPKENEYQFKKGIVFNEKDMVTMNWTFAVNMSPADSLKLALKVGVGVLSGNIRFRTVKALLKGVSCATKLKKLYKGYPKTPTGYAKWRKKTAKVWDKTMPNGK